MPLYSDSIYASPYQSSSIDPHTPFSALTPSSFASPNKRPATPFPALNFDGVPSFPYFVATWTFKYYSFKPARSVHYTQAAKNNFNKDKPKFSLQLQIEERSLEFLKDLIRRRDRNLTVTNPLRVKVAESNITFPFFTPGDAFPFTFDGTTTNDDQDGDSIDASRFAAGDKVAVQAWFGSYVFTSKSGKTMSGPSFSFGGCKLVLLAPRA
ncbi:hypothetical protein B0O99DRAFT_710389 [Bisporella sp. PMI_857]|nr:hypothetical protein B0O99DRAFT_710389 [Bisporella sp. PMI_857]